LKHLGILCIAVSTSLAACAPQAEQRRKPTVTTANVSLQDLPFIPDAFFQESEAESTGTGAIQVYNANSVALVPTPLYRGIKVMSDGALTAQGTFLPLLVTDDVTAIDANLTITRDFYRDTFQRDSYDGQGADIKAAVEVQQYHLVPILGMKENAAWMAEFDHFIFGAGGAQLAGFPQALDVVGHEFTHAVVSYSSNLEYVGQSGALNEHLADVFGEIIQHKAYPSSVPFLIGETTLRGAFAEQARALRDMLDPQAGLSAQPGAMDEIPAEFGVDCDPAANNDNCGVHILSGIPNRAAALVIQQIGWTKAARLYYAVMTERLEATSDFEAYRDAVFAECAQTLSASECTRVEDAYHTVGL
jgi:Zn-dependent metalloprotease